jgi:hypothetical protein
MDLLDRLAEFRHAAGDEGVTTATATIDAEGQRHFSIVVSLPHGDRVETSAATKDEAFWQIANLLACRKAA